MNTFRRTTLALAFAGASASVHAQLPLPPNAQDIETVCRYVFGDFDTNHVIHLVGSPSPSGGLGPEKCEVYIACNNWGSGTFSVTTSDQSSRALHGFSLNRYTKVLNNLKSLESDVILMTDRYSHTEKLHVMMTYLEGRKKISSVAFEYFKNPSGSPVDVAYPTDFRCENLELAAE